MYRLLSVSLLISFLALTSMAQDDDSSSESYRPKGMKTKVGGAGGFTPAWGLFNFDEINKALRGAGMPALPSQPMYLAGGEGYGYIMFLKNVRMGGSGVGGTVTSSSYNAATNTKKTVDYHVSYGGFLVDYVIPLASRLECAVGFTIGGGSIDITTMSDDGKFKQWGTLWSEFGNNDSTTNITRHLNGSFFTFQPGIKLEYAILRWFQIRVGVSYPLMSGASWKLEADKEILDVPEALKTKGAVVNAGIMFGFFN